MKNIIKHTVIVFISAILFSSCTKEVLRGEGSITTETRNLAAFSAIEIAGNRQAEIILSTESKVEITGYQNLVAAYKSNVSNGQLRFDYHNCTKVQNDNISLKIYTPSLSSINMSGNADVKMGGNFSGNYFEAMLSGNGILRMQGGNFSTVKLNSSGSAKVYASAVVSNQANVFVSGNGYMEVQATKALDVRISGNGEVHYWGNPTVSSNISGNGKIVRH
jgi:Putative auto-transporter adhesin, head GIN domain